MIAKTLLVAALMISVSTAFAQSPTPHRRPAAPDNIFLSADANKDGRVTRDEFLDARTEIFARLDVNADGFLDQVDVRESGRRPPAKRDEFDADVDGRVSKYEYVNGQAPMFTCADVDHDEVLSAAELESLSNMNKCRPNRVVTSGSRAL